MLYTKNINLAININIAHKTRIYINRYIDDKILSDIDIVINNIK